MFLSIIIVTVIWKLVCSSSLLMALISFCLSSTLYEMKVHHSLYAFEHELESVPYKFELPSMLDAMHPPIFCSQINPLACLPVINAMADKFDHHDAAQHAVNWMNAFLLQQTISFGQSKKDKSIKRESKVGFKHTPLIWDTGATHELTPLMKDFIHLHPCDIPVKDISKVNWVIGVGTVMRKFWATNGKDIFLPEVSFHLPTADIQLMSPQSYHQWWGGYSLVGKEGVLMNLWRPDGKPSHVLKFQLDEHSNTPTVS
jgi:hypothetical protein